MSPGIRLLRWRRTGRLFITALILALTCSALSNPAGAQDADDLSIPAGAQDADDPLRIVARKLPNGAVEFGLQQQIENSWEQRLLPTRRRFPPSAPVNRWLASTPLEIDGRRVRVVARRLANDKVEFALQQRTVSNWGGILFPARRLFPADAPIGRWLISSPVSLLSASGDVREEEVCASLLPASTSRSDIRDFCGPADQASTSYRFFLCEDLVRVNISYLPQLLREPSPPIRITHLTRIEFHPSCASATYHMALMVLHKLSYGLETKRILACMWVYNTSSATGSSSSRLVELQLGEGRINQTHIEARIEGWSKSLVLYFSFVDPCTSSFL